jgi:hypothetical protein
MADRQCVRQCVSVGSGMDGTYELQAAILIVRPVASAQLAMRGGERQGQETSDGRTRKQGGKASAKEERGLFLITALPARRAPLARLLSTRVSCPMYPRAPAPALPGCAGHWPLLLRRQ